MSVRRMCESASVSRAGFYRFRSCATRPAKEGQLHDAVQRIALEWPSYGSRRITAELRRRGWRVNRKRVQRVMREDNLLCLRKRKFVATTDSKHAERVYPNLAHAVKPTRPDQLWVADITYVHLKTETVYLAVVMDAFSRKVIGFSLDRTLETTLPLGALEMALGERQPAAGLIHHSDRGVQYASRDYTGLLKHHGIAISMSAKGNPYDNAFMESFMKTLKMEEVYRSDYLDLADARARIGRFLRQVYNRRRLHSALGYVPPVEFEANYRNCEKNKGALECV